MWKVVGDVLLWVCCRRGTMSDNFVKLRSSSMSRNREADLMQSGIFKQLVTYGDGWRFRSGVERRPRGEYRPRRRVR